MKLRLLLFVLVGIICFTSPLSAQWQPPVNLGSGVNCSVADNSPWLNTTGDTLLIGSFRTGGFGAMDIWNSYRDEGVWQPVVNVGYPVSTSHIEISPCLTPDRNSLYYSSQRPGGMGNFDVWVSHKSNGDWGTPMAVTEVNSIYSEFHPFITSDGQYMYLTSDRPGGPGDKDIYISRLVDSTWSEPQLIPGNVNSVYDEAHASLTDDGQTMYFSSSRPGGSGGPDVYVSHWNGSEWTSPTNLGPGVNCNDTDQWPAISGDGVKLVFVSARDGGFGNFDIWETTYLSTNTLYGTVSLNDSPPDISGAVVAIGNIIDTTDIYGQYELSEVPMDTLTLIAFKPGYEPFDTVLVSPSGEFNITLYPGASPTSFVDDFEGGMRHWYGSWSLTDETAYSGTYSMTDSPNSDYPANQNMIQTMVQGVDLSQYQSASITFYAKYELEESFDYVYLEASLDSGMTWSQIAEFNGTESAWNYENIDIGYYVGNDYVLLRFRLNSDSAVQADGMYIDDLSIQGTNIDTTPPLITHTPDPDTLSWIEGEDVVVMAQITDISGVNEASLFYSIDNDSSFTEVFPFDIVGDNYYFTIPFQYAGTWINYYLTASDNASPPNSGESATFGHIFGTIIYYDDAYPEFIYTFSVGDKIAVRFSPDSPQYIVSLLYNFYTDPSNPLDTVDVYVWENLNGMPTQVKLGPIPVYPSNTPSTPHAWTLLDLRPYELLITEDFHAGCQFRSSFPAILGDSPGITDRSRVWYGGTWGAAACDYYIRAVVGYYGVSTDNVHDQAQYNLKFAPNPFRNFCQVSFSLSRSQNVKITLYNIRGQKIATIVDDMLDSGSHILQWDAKEIASGVYFMKFKTKSESQEYDSIKKILLLK